MDLIYALGGTILFSGYIGELLYAIPEVRSCIDNPL